MQLTRHEITSTQILVTTPEKWDVVTRKSTGDVELVQVGFGIGTLTNLSEDVSVQSIIKFFDVTRK